MTAQEAIKWIEARMRSGWTQDEVWQAGDIAIKAIEKQIEMEPKLLKGELSGDIYYRCPICGRVVGKKVPYCRICGQKIKWDN